MESQDKSPLKRTGDNSALYFSSGDGDGFKAVAQAKESTSVASCTLSSSFFDHRFLRLSVFGFGRYATSAALTNTEQLSGVSWVRAANSFYKRSMKFQRKLHNT